MEMADKPEESVPPEKTAAASEQPSGTEEIEDKLSKEIKEGFKRQEEHLEKLFEKFFKDFFSTIAPLIGRNSDSSRFLSLQRIAVTIIGGFVLLFVFLVVLLVESSLRGQPETSGWNLTLGALS